MTEATQRTDATRQVGFELGGEFEHELKIDVRRPPWKRQAEEQDRRVRIAESGQASWTMHCF